MRATHVIASVAFALAALCVSSEIQANPDEHADKTRALVEAFAPLATGGSVTRTSVQEGTISAALVDLDADERASIRSAFLHGSSLYAFSREQMGFVKVLAMQFDTEDAAGAFLAAKRARLAIDPAWSAYGAQDGAGHQNKLPGFHSRDAGGIRTLQMLRHEATVLAVTVWMYTALTRPHQDQWIAYALARRAQGSQRKPPDLPAPAKGRIVVVRFLDPSGQPVAEGEAQSFGGAWVPIEQGVARLRMGPPSLWVRARGLKDRQGRSLEMPVHRPHTGASERTIRLAYRSSTPGQVVDAKGRPVADVTVSAMSTGANSHNLNSATTDANGRFVIEGLRESFGIRLSRKGHGAVRGEPTLGTPGAPLRIQLTPSVAVRLRVFGPGGTPLGEAFVSSPDTHYGYVTNENGETVITGFEPGTTATFLIRGPFRNFEIAPQRLSVRTGSDYEVHLAAAWTLHGVVQDEQGRRIPSALQVDDGVRKPYSWGTRPDGSFTLGPLPPGPVRVRASAKASPWQTFWGLSKAVVLHVADLHFSVQVRDVSGRAVPGFSALLETESGSSRLLQGFGGVATFASPSKPSRLTIFAARDERGAASDLAAADFDVAAGAAQLDVVLLPGREVTGWVTADGKPIAGVKIRARTPDTNVNTLAPHGETTSRADGSFVLLGLSKQPYELDVEPPAPRAAPTPIRLGLDEDSFSIALPDAVRLLLVDAKQRPVQDARVRVEDGTGVSRTKSGPQGVVWIRRVQDGRLSIDPPYRRPDLRAWRDDRWDATPKTIAIGRSPDLPGRVHRGGVPIAGAVVTLQPGGQRATTDDDGRFRFPRPIDRPRHLVVRTPDGRTLPPYEVQSRVDIDFDLAIASRAVHLRDASTGDRGWILGVSQDAAYPTPHEFAFDANGHARLPQLRLGNYAIWVPKVGHDGSCAFHASLRFTGYQIRLSARPTKTLVLLLDAPEGTALPEITVTGPLGQSMYVRRTLRGYAVDGLPTGSWRVQVKARALTGWVGADVRAWPGGSPTRVTLTPRSTK